jgi:hypothetical protein
MFHYTHHDGRTGKGWSVWAAIGSAEANALPELTDPLWSYDHGWGEDVVRVAPVLTKDDIDLGTVREMNPDRQDMVPPR